MEWQDFSEYFTEQLADVLTAVPNLLGSLLVFMVFWMVAKYAEVWERKISQRIGVDAYLGDVLGRIIRYTVVIVGMVTALGTLGVDVTAMVAAMGLAGFAVAFAFQDIIGNFLAGIIIMFQQPFKPGEVVSVADVQGRVEEIRSRDTVMRTLDGRRAIVPNRTILNNEIVNFSYNPVRRFDIAVGVAYDTDLLKALEVCLNIVTEMEAVVEEPQPQVLLTEFADSSINLELRFWIDTTEHSFMDVRTEVMRAVKQRFDAEGINIPFPIRTVHLEPPMEEAEPKTEAAPESQTEET